jgi:hypothetical protein
LRNTNNNKLFNEKFYIEIKDLSQQDKYTFLKDQMYSIGINISQENNLLKNILDNVFNFFQNRAKWKNLYKARDDIIKLSINYKEQYPSKRDSKMTLWKSNRSNVPSLNNGNETEELHSVLKDLSKIVKNVEESDHNNSIFE